MIEHSLVRVFFHYYFYFLSNFKQTSQDILENQTSQHPQSSCDWLKQSPNPPGQEVKPGAKSTKKKRKEKKI